MIKPIGNRVLVSQHKKEVGTIIVSQEFYEKLPRGKVVAISDEVNEIKVGDEVIFNRLSGEILEDSGEFLILKVNEILAKVC